MFHILWISILSKAMEAKIQEQWMVKTHGWRSSWSAPCSNYEHEQGYTGFLK